MVVYPNCKINIGLNIISKRPDGFHNIESVFYPVPWCDMLEIIPSAANSFVFDGFKINCPLEENLCYKAWQLLRLRFDIPNISLYLYKKIPFGAGLGGGSSDGAFVLKTLNELFGLDLDRDAIANMASELGSDCTFFVDNRPCFVSGTGADIAPVELSLKGYYVMVVKPAVSVSTVEAYRMVTPQKPVLRLSDVIKMPVTAWEKCLSNDFESPVMEQYPTIRRIKDRLYEMGAVYAAMSGSGAAVYGLFEQEVDTDKDFAGCQLWKGWLY
ncbi:MAG TPA: 4-(cytidine 5'-diphospho)-2-C-methyl-D-erythritol kinase [Bacteroidales bacterium]|nr:4-(cytidine 5'-diphospho)-2-C-methyl-D-erythritol kinase [Bacteroidales bacterium]